MTSFDWQYYVNANPDLAASGVIDSNKARQHWRSKGMRGGRIGQASISPTTSADGAAFALNLDNAALLQLLEASVDSSLKKDQPLMEQLAGHMSIVIPNVFVNNSSVGTKLARTIKWIDNLYEEI
jgi:hypothetical protein